MHRIHPVPLVLTGLFLGAGCYFEDPSDTENLPPVINSFIIEGEKTDLLVMREGDEVSVTINAWDPNGDDLLPENIAWETAEGTSLGTGPSIGVAAPAGIQWSTPPEPYRFTVTAFLSDGVNPAVSRDLTVEILPPCEDSNQPPVINGVYADPEDITLGERTTVWVEAEDPEGRDLTFEWTPEFGIIEGTGDRVDWVTDEVCCTDWYDVEVVVSDGCKSTWGFVLVHVDV
jgi:hypothetical protein